VLCVVYVLVRHVDVMLSGVEAQGQTRTSAAHRVMRGDLKITPPQFGHMIMQATKGTES